MATKVNIISYGGKNGMYIEGNALKGQLVNHYEASSVSADADASSITNGSYMFYGCDGLTSWNVAIPNLTNGSYMFNDCNGLTSWTVNLPNLTNGNSMFAKCTNLTSWTVNLPNLTNGYSMFNTCNGLTSWTVDLPNLTDGAYMFYYCKGLTSFAGDLSKLAGTSATTGGSNMFSGCAKLTSFNSTLPALAYAKSMFQNCILDAASVLRILNSIPTHSSGTHELHLGKYTNYQTSVDVAAKLRTAGGGTVTTPIAAATNYRCVDENGNDKGWTITITA